MAKATLETLPPEILHQIFSLVVAQKDEYTTSLCCTSKRIREFSSAALYGTLTPHEPSGPDELSLQRVVALFHALTLNPRLGELVQEIDLFHLYTCTKWEPSHLQMFQGIYTMWRNDDCPTPRGIVNSLKPIAEQMKELKLSHFDRWIVKLCHETGVSRYAQKFVEPAGVLEPLEFLTVLERLDVDSDCLWVQRHPYVNRSNYEKVMHLIKLLPQRLQDLKFDGLNDDDADGDDPDPRIHFVREVALNDGDENMENSEEQWDSIDYPPGLAPEQLQTLKQAFAEVGIAFHPSERDEYEIEKRILRHYWHSDIPQAEWF
ncbi:hypothetical protein K4K60_010336 [Colletotrichum sp. SAR11_57]|nr:hypothetical protein K4K60_010336 [Colletotrichum sp. SAR11_57]